MKYGCLLIFCFLSFTHLWGQNNVAWDWKGSSEIRVGIGPVPAIPYADYWSYDEDVWIDPGIDINGSDVYTGARYTTGGIFVGYNYHLKRWLSLGVYGTFTSMYRNYYYQYPKHRAGKSRDTYFSFIPTVEFNWLNRKYVRMYTSFGLGVAFVKSRNTYGGWNTHEVWVAGQFTALGIVVGRRLFTFLECPTVGSRGSVVNVGVGYRFNYEK